ncbi:MAG: hypothetical protein ABI401_00350 [Candidatus Dormibacter sp.]
MKGLPRMLASLSVCTVVLLVNSVFVVASGNPGRTPVPPGPTMVFDVCSPAVGPVIGFQGFTREYSKAFSRSDGTVVVAINGAASTGFTRVASGKTLIFNSSGPARITFYPDGSATYLGGGLNIVVNPTGIWQYAGHIQIDLATGLVLSHSGRVTDVCALLM